MKRASVGLAVILAGFLPLMASAQGFENVKGLIESVGEIVGVLLPIVFALAVLAFFYGLVRYIWSVGDEEKVNGKKIMIWGVVAIAVMASLYGLVGFLQESFDIDAEETIEIPKVPGAK